MAGIRLGYRYYIAKSITIQQRSEIIREFSQARSLNPLSSDEIKDFRLSTAPWIRIGDYQKGLMSHLTMFEIFRSLSVLKLCSYDFLMDRTMQFLNLYKKLGFLLEWPVRKTFFNQFVGGDTIPRMEKAVDSMHNRGLQLLLCPVIEEDVEDEKSANAFYDDNLHILMDLIELTSHLEKDKPMFHLKPTALMPAITLEKVSNAINQRCKYSETTKLTKVIEEIAKSVENWNALSSLNIDKDEFGYFIDGLRRSDILIQVAKKAGVHVLVDAEFHSCKPAISAIALALMARHNAHGHFVGNTIQGYLKEAYPTIKAELNVVTREIGVNWFGKIVRGAYMDRERYLAKKRDIPSPIWDTYEETNNSYNKCVAHVLEHIAQNKNSQTHLVIAGHNERSIRLAAQKMKDLALLPEEGHISFGQIYGMSDYLSTPMVREGYKVYKSTPYGPIEGVLPYLARRASENRSVIRGSREERKMLRQELKTRFSLRA